MEIRMATLADSPGILDIYNQYIHTNITFEYHLPSEEAFQERMRHILAKYPYLVCLQDEHIIGYAYAHEEREREAYQWNAELSVYLDQEHLSQGLGKKLYLILMEILQIQRIKMVYAGITLPNEKSEALHNNMGFKPIGIHKNTGFKNGQWLDVMWLDKAIAPHEQDPMPFLPINEISTETINAIIRKYT